MLRGEATAGAGRGQAGAARPRRLRPRRAAGRCAGSRLMRHRLIDRMRSSGLAHLSTADALRPYEHQGREHPTTGACPAPGARLAPIAPERASIDGTTPRSAPWGWPAPPPDRASGAVPAGRLVIKVVMLLLLVASLWCWAVIFDKTFRLARLSRKANAFERAVLVRRPAGRALPPARQARRPPDGADVRDRHGGMAGIAARPPTSASTAAWSARIGQVMDLTSDREVESLERTCSWLGDHRLDRTVRRACSARSGAS